MFSKYIFYSFLIITYVFIFIACDDGDLQLEPIDFDNVNVKHCGDISLNTTYFYKQKGSEILILKIPEGLLKNEVPTTEISSLIPSESNVYHRSFKNTLPEDYFCNPLPYLLEFNEQITADSGDVIFKTEEITEGGTIKYKHTVTFKNIILTNRNGQRVIDETVLFGEIITIVP